MEWKDALVPILATYGAILATINTILAIRKSGRYVKATISYSRVIQLDGVSIPLICLEAANVGETSVTVTGITCELADGHHIAFLEPYYTSSQLPQDLKPGTNCRVFISSNELAVKLSKEGITLPHSIRARVSTATGQIFRSKPLAFEVHSSTS